MDKETRELLVEMADCMAELVRFSARHCTEKHSEGFPANLRRFDGRVNAFKTRAEALNVPDVGKPGEVIGAATVKAKKEKSS